MDVVSKPKQFRKESVDKTIDFYNNINKHLMNKFYKYLPRKLLSILRWHALLQYKLAMTGKV